jgi:hypothetical protein
MNTRLPSWAAAACLLLAAAGAHADTLVARFDLPPAGEWRAVALPLAPGAWRIGSRDGPPADAARLRTLLSALAALEIGGHCASAVDGSTSYPCGFAVADLDIGGRASLPAPLSAIDWPQPDTPARNPTAGSPPVGSMRPVAVLAPAALLGNRGDAYGGVLRFRVKPVSNPVVASTFDFAAGGTVVLRSTEGARVASR